MNRIFWAALAKTIFLAAPAVVLMVYAIYLGNLVLVEKFHREIPPGVAYFAVIIFTYLIGKLFIGKELTQMKAARDKRPR